MGVGVGVRVGVWGGLDVVVWVLYMSRRFGRVVLVKTIVTLMALLFRLASIAGWRL